MCSPFLGTRPINHSGSLILLSSFTSNQPFHLHSQFKPTFCTLKGIAIFLTSGSLEGHLIYKGERGRESDLESRETRKKLSHMKVGRYLVSTGFHIECALILLPSTRVWPREVKTPWPLGGFISGNFILTLSSLPSPASTLPNCRIIGPCLGAPFPRLQNGKAPFWGQKPSKL